MNFKLDEIDASAPFTFMEDDLVSMAVDTCRMKINIFGTEMNNLEKALNDLMKDRKKMRIRLENLFQENEKLRSENAHLRGQANAEAVPNGK